MPIIETDQLIQGQVFPEQRSVYCGLDTMLTLEIRENLQHIIDARKGSNSDPINTIAYDYARSFQGPALELNLRGILVDRETIASAIHSTRKQLIFLQWALDEFAQAWGHKSLNANSPKQLQTFFYETMGLEKIWTSKKGVRKLSLDRETLEKLEVNLYAMPIIATILAIRDQVKRISVLETEIDSDWRMRTSYNVAGTETWRLSSSSSVIGTGTNLQNITPSLRHIFIADPGWKICAIDLEQTESRDVGWLHGTILGDWTYLDAIDKSGDLHSYVTKMVWPQLSWSPGDFRENIKRNKEVAETNFYREFSHRDMAKRGGHLTNYYGTPWTASRHLKVPLVRMQEFRKAYLDAFPGFEKWWAWTIQQLQLHGTLTNSFGFTRRFFGRPNDPATQREAIAFTPQSNTAIRMNTAIGRMWRQMRGRIQLLGQVHDAVYFQFRKEENSAEIIREALTLIEFPLSHPSTSRKLIVPGEAKVGWNLGAFHVHDSKCPPACPKRENPNGLVKWKGEDLRMRV